MERLTPTWGTIGSKSQKGKAGDVARPSAEQRGRDSKKKSGAKRPAPFSLRLTFEERRQLEQDSGRQSISSYIKSRLFDPDAPVKQARGLYPVKDHEALSQALGLLGQSGLTKRLAELAEAARIGAFPVEDETEKALRRACDDVRVMRQFLLAALGIRDTARKPDVNESCSSCFSRAVAHTGDEPLDQEPTP